MREPREDCQVTLMTKLTVRSMAFGSALLTATLLAMGMSAHAATTLTSVEVAPEGRLLRVTLKADAPLIHYTLARQGPPEKRDLTVRIPGARSTVPLPVDTGEYVMPVAIGPDGKEADALLLVLSGVGDSLVRVAQESDRLTLTLIPPERRSDAADAYRIGPNDILQIDVFGHDDLSKTLKVSPRGSVNFPLIGTVSADGRSVDEVALDIKERLAKDYLQDPQVVVSVWEYLSQWVNVMGEVAQPGRFYMTGPMSLIDALSQAGGLTPAAGTEILITRRAEEVDPASAGEVFRVDVKALLGADGARLNHRLRNGDTVNIPGRAAAEALP